MEEGVENDDKYRMVEDEFYSIAHRFTVHLHAAEYKRQVKEVKARKADAIKSISRPVTGVMPDQTRRKVESVTRSSAQKRALEGLLGKKADDISDDSDTEALPYVGTTLHGLMDSPRKRAASLLKAGSIPATTRAAAGFKRPAAEQKSPIILLDSPSTKYVHRNGDKLKQEQASATESEEEDDDLDAPIPAPKLISDKVSFKDSAITSSTPSTIAHKPTPFLKAVPVSTRTPIQKDSPFQKHVVRSSISLDLPTVHSSDKARTSRVEHARRHRAKQEPDEQKSKKLEEFPSFL